MYHQKQKYHFTNRMGVKFLVEENENGTSKISGNCVFTGELHSFELPTKDLRAWFSGKQEPIQVTLKDVKPEDREFLISGISPKGWEQTFSQGEEN